MKLLLVLLMSTLGLTMHPEDSQAPFRLEHRYLAKGQPVGWHLVHEATGFRMDLVPMETAPQSYVWIDTPPVSDGGDPHTLEHLLLGKGRRGFTVAGREAFRMIESSAYTRQLETCYHFNSGLDLAGFLEDFELRMEALLHPDFSDEEIRREVAHVGVKDGPDVELEEKGTVYTEMISSWDHPWSRAAYLISGWCFGKGHPMAYMAGGIPAAIRELEPADIRDFHTSTHTLARMHGVLVLPLKSPQDAPLAELDRILLALQGEAQRGRPVEALPAAKPETEAQLKVLDVPGHTEGMPGLVLMAWPPANQEPVARLKTQMLLYAVGGGEGSDLYRQFLASTAQDPLGAAWISAFQDQDEGHVIWMALGSVPSERINETELEALRGLIMARLDELELRKRGDKDLEALRQRMQSSLTGMRRESLALLDEPPGFGQRSGVSHLPDYLRELRGLGGRNLDFNRVEVLDMLEQELKELDNPYAAWRQELQLMTGRAHLVGTRSEPRLLEEKEKGRVTRLAAFADSLQSSIGSPDLKTALEAFRQNEEIKIAEMDEAREGLKQAELPERLPLHPDPDFPGHASQLLPDLPMLQGVFEQMNGVEFNLSMNLLALEPELVLGTAHWLSLLPSLLCETGLDVDGVRKTYTRVQEELREDCRWAGCWLDTDMREGYAGLVWSSVGANQDECRKGLEWLRSFLNHADLGPENLARIRELVRRDLANLRQRRQGGEESWVENPAYAWMQRDNELLLHAGSFLSAEFDAFRASWTLEQAAAGMGPAIGSLFALGRMDVEARGELLARLADWAEAASGEGGFPPEMDGTGWNEWLQADDGQLKQALQDLRAFNAEMETRHAEYWVLLCNVLWEEASRLPQDGLAELQALLLAMRQQTELRAWLTSNSENARLLRPEFEAFARELRAVSAAPSVEAARWTEIPFPEVKSAGAQLAGLIYEGLSSGVVIHRVPMGGIQRPDRDALLDNLAARVYGGGGAHGLFMRTWGAGLAYSNGASPSEIRGKLRYYAERCPDVSQTLRFVEEIIREAPAVTPQQLRYAFAGAFAWHRKARNFTNRTSDMARESQLFKQSEAIREYRSNMRDLLDEKGLTDEVDKRLRPVMSGIFPGLQQQDSVQIPEEGFYFLIGPGSQFDLYSTYLEQSGLDMTPRRLRPCDYWCK